MSHQGEHYEGEDYRRAIEALRQHGAKEAADWWQMWYDDTGHTGRTLVFAPNCGEFITEGTAAVVPKHSAAAMTAMRGFTKPPHGIWCAELFSSLEEVLWRQFEESTVC